MMHKIDEKLERNADLSTPKKYSIMIIFVNHSLFLAIHIIIPLFVRTMGTELQLLSLRRDSELPSLGITG
jgi:hypothetical protein